MAGCYNWCMCTIISFMSIYAEIFAVKAYKTTKDKLVFTVNLGEGIMVPTGLRLQLMEKADTNPHLSPDVYKGTNPITYVYENPPKGLFTSIVNVSVVDSNGHETSEPITMDLSTELDHSKRICHCAST